MARFTVWLRGYVLNLVKGPGSKRSKKLRKSQSAEALGTVRTLRISEPLPIEHDGATFIIPTNRLERSISVQNLTESHPRPRVRPMNAEIEAPPTVAMVTEQAHPVRYSTLSPIVTVYDANSHNPSRAPGREQELEVPELTAEEDSSDDSDTLRAGPSPVYSQSLDDLPQLPDTPPTHGPDIRFVHSSGDDDGSGFSSDYMVFQRMSYYSAMNGTKRMSQYTVMSRFADEHANPNGKRNSRYSTMSKDENKDDLAQKRLSRRFSRRMSMGLEAYHTHVSTYVPLRI